jgi:hypothetical protein
MCVSDTYTARSKHINLRYHYIRGLVAAKVINIEYIKGSQQVADTFTKGLGSEAFKGYRAQLGVREKDNL